MLNKQFNFFLNVGNGHNNIIHDFAKSFNINVVSGKRFAVMFSMAEDCALRKCQEVHSHFLFKIIQGLLPTRLVSSLECSTWNHCVNKKEKKYYSLWLFLLFSEDYLKLNNMLRHLGKCQSWIKCNWGEHSWASSLSFHLLIKLGMTNAFEGIMKVGLFVVRNEQGKKTPLVQRCSAFQENCTDASILGTEPQ